MQKSEESHMVFKYSIPFLESDSIPYLLDIDYITAPNIRVPKWNPSSGINAYDKLSSYTVREARSLFPGDVTPQCES